MTGNRAHARHDFDVPVEVVVDGAGLQFEVLRAIEVWALGKLLRKLEE